MALTWKESEAIAEALRAAHPDVDPLSVRFTLLLDWILALEGFTGRREECNEKKLEAVQMAWHEEACADPDD